MLVTAKTISDKASKKSQTEQTILEETLSLFSTTTLYIEQPKYKVKFSGEMFMNYPLHLMQIL